MGLFGHVADTHIVVSVMNWGAEFVNLNECSGAPRHVFLYALVYMTLKLRRNRKTYPTGLTPPRAVR